MMISQAKPSKEQRATRLATGAHVLLLACCALLALVSLPNAVRGLNQHHHRQPQDVAPSNQQQHPYHLLGGADAVSSPGSPYLLASQFDQAQLEPSDAAIVADLLNSFSERHSLSPSAISSSESLIKAQRQQQQHGTPGHYEFEVAPKMEPPSAPRPPFKQANSVCPGSDLFGGFSPKDTLCGDLYQGRVPLNPMGQSVNEQAYPFELIKNKTLQFLAKSLPILKTEYETIPKVARYLPANQLLNPTSHQSPLGHEHFHELNQNQLAAGFAMASPPPFLRRKKRQTAAHGVPRQASITVAELMPNASLVVSSAHSAGRIGAGGGHHQSRSADAHHSFAMITKDGYRSIGSAAGGAGSRESSADHHQRAAAAAGHVSAQQITVSSSLALRPAHDHAGDLAANNKPPTAAGVSRQQAASAAAAGQQMADISQNNAPGAQHARPAPFAAASHVGSNQMANGATGQSNGISSSTSSAPGQQLKLDNDSPAPPSPPGRMSSRSANNNNNNNNNSPAGLLATTNSIHVIAPLASTTAAAAGPAQRNHATANGDNKAVAADSPPASSHLQARSASHGHHLNVVDGGAGETGGNNAGQSRHGATNGQQQPTAAAAPNSQLVVQAKSAGGSSISSPSSPSSANGAGQQQHSRCANVNGLLLYTACQAASALVEGADSTPGWLQAAKQIGNLYSAASSADSYASSQAAANPIWALWNAFAGGSGASDSRSSDPSIGTDLTYKSAAAAAANKLSAGSSVASMIQLLNPLMSFFAPSLQRAGAADVSASSSGRLDKSSNHSSSATAASHHNSHQSFSSNLRAISGALLTGLSLAGLYDWFGTPANVGATLFSPMSATFARRKKPFDPSETFVDTPASLAALASAKQLTPGAGSGAGSGAPFSGKQPPTPCPSVEEYISPTFARNYQGAWKYVVQIPHEGYFTQTIQRSSCMRQKCEFTEGVCHEAPRWVSLLVAEIYYPNAIFGSTSSSSTSTSVSTNAAGQLQTPASSSSSQIINQRMSLAAGNQFDSVQNAALLSQLMMASPSASNLQQVSPFNTAAAAAGQNNQQQHQAKSMTSQDPLQMTDSLNTYNHNLNSAFFSAATELGLDPTNVAQMQQLANAHNYQLMQRSGLVSNQIESRAGGQITQAAPTQSAAYQYATMNQQQQQQQQQQSYQQPMKQQQQQQQQTQMDQQVALNNDYIKALAIETLRQNPHLSVDDLIKSLQLQQATRKKRDLSGQSVSGSQQQQQQQPHREQQITVANGSPGSHVQYGASSGGGGGQQVRAATANHHHHRNQHVHARSSGPQMSQAPQPTTTTTVAAQLESLPSINELGSLTAAAAAAQQQQALELAGLAQPSLLAQQTASSPTQLHNSAPSANNQQLAAASTLNGQSGPDNLGQAATNQPPGTAASAQASGSPTADANSVECDGHDKIGCYVVRVYYDWFLVNGSCKCWKTNTLGQQTGSSSSGSASSTGSGSNGGSGSFIRRIFTG